MRPTQPENANAPQTATVPTPAHALVPLITMCAISASTPNANVSPTFFYHSTGSTKWAPIGEYFCGCRPISAVFAAVQLGGAKLIFRVCRVQVLQVAVLWLRNHNTDSDAEELHLWLFLFLSL
ncbi:hypothetical protein Fot_30488 [Forsythia ovata]|uniref:Uncharacterized protein n=1 Tax=Forsythia ovata TaxID=205694 RepID=A0ABD1P135_9LAMI